MSSIELDFPLADWAADRDVTGDPMCPDCFGEGVTADEEACPCLVTAVKEAFPEAAEQAQATPGCRRCDGDGEDWDGLVCPCLIEDLRRVQEAREAA